MLTFKCLLIGLVIHCVSLRLAAQRTSCKKKHTHGCELLTKVFFTLWCFSLRCLSFEVSQR